MTERTEQAVAEAIDDIVEEHRAGTASAGVSDPATGDAAELANLALRLEADWLGQPRADEDRIWRRVSAEIQATPQRAPARSWSLPFGLTFPPALSFALPEWAAGRAVALGGAALVLVLVVAATFASQRDSADTLFVNDVESLARFTAAVLNDEQLSLRERGEVERRASGLLSAIEANPTMLAGLTATDADRLVSRIDSILTLLEPYEGDEQGGVGTSVVPLATVREQIEHSRGGGDQLPSVSSGSEAPSPTSVAAAAAETATPEPRSTATPRRTPDPMRTPSATATPEERFGPAMPPLERGSLNELCGNERERDQNRCRAAMAEVTEECDRGADSERCRDAVEDAVEACRDLRNDRDAANCERILLLLAGALAGPEPERTPRADNSDDERDDDRDSGRDRGGDGDRDDDDDDRRRDDDRERSRQWDRRWGSGGGGNR